jgi:hypothetical protein
MTLISVAGVATNEDMINIWLWFIQVRRKAGHLVEGCRVLFNGL